MKRKGIGFKRGEEKAVDFTELRFLGVLSAVVLGVLFECLWIIPVGVLLYIFGVLAEFNPKPYLKLSTTIPVISFSYFGLALYIEHEFMLAALLYGGISTYLIYDAASILKDTHLSDV